MNKKILITIIVIILLVGVGIFAWYQFIRKPITEQMETPEITPEIKEIIETTPQITEPLITTIVLLETNKGNIKIGLFDEHRPITVENFVSLIKKNFYDGIIFHRVIEGFMIQGGCPLGQGIGGPGYAILCELEGYNKNRRGTISMANAGPNTGGSQFFINLVDNNFLDGGHSVFGKVLEGIEVVDIISQIETDPNDRPVQEIIIKNIEIVVE